MASEQLLLLLLLSLLWLFQFIVPVLKRRVDEIARQTSKTETISCEVCAVPAPRVEFHAPGRRAPLPLVVPPTSRQRTRSPVGGLRSLRRGIILMTILGPCRALDSPEPRAPEGFS